MSLTGEGCVCEGEGCCSTIFLNDLFSLCLCCALTAEQVYVVAYYPRVRRDTDPDHAIADWACGGGGVGVCIASLEMLPWLWSNVLFVVEKTRWYPPPEKLPLRGFTYSLVFPWLVFTKWTDLIVHAELGLHKPSLRQPGTLSSAFFGYLRGLLQLFWLQQLLDCACGGQA